MNWVIHAVPKPSTLHLGELFCFTQVAMFPQRYMPRQPVRHFLSWGPHLVQEFSTSKSYRKHWYQKKNPMPWVTIPRNSQQFAPKIRDDFRQGKLASSNCELFRRVVHPKLKKILQNHNFTLLNLELAEKSLGWKTSYNQVAKPLPIYHL